MRRGRRAATILYALAGLAGGRLGAQPLTPEFRINTTTTLSQVFPSVAPLSANGYIVVWGSQEGSFTGVFGQRLNVVGNPIGGGFRVNAVTTGDQSHPAVASDAAGNFVVVWTGYSGFGGSPGIFGRRFSSNGAPLDSDFRVNSTTTNDVLFPAVASDPAGNFVVAWELFESGVGSLAIVARRFSSSGAPLGGTFRVNTSTAGYYFTPRVAAWSGGFVVVWGNEAPGNLQDVFGQRYDASGAELGGEFRVNAYTTGAQADPDVVALPGGGFVVVWDGEAANEVNGIRPRRFDASGAPVGGGFLVNTYTTGFQENPRIARDGLGNFIVTWRSAGQDGDGQGVYAQRLSGSGEPLGTEFKVNTNTAGDQGVLGLAVAASGAAEFYTIVFSDADGSNEGVWAVDYCLVGDANADGVLDVLDVFYLINGLFAGGPGPNCADVDANGHTDVADVFYVINYLFAGGPPPI
jgi:hypothetical protein